MNKLVDIIKNPSFIKNERIKTMPFVYYPDGKPCFIINSYMLKLVEYNMSFHTLKQKANNLTHILKYCFNKNINFYALKEKDLISLSTFLIEEEKENNRVRTKNTVIDIIKTTLDFLFFVGEMNNDPNFIFNQISASKKEYDILLKEKNINLKNKGWVHKAIPFSEPYKSRLPVSQNNINKLYESINNLNTSKYLKQRRIQMLHLLEITGARAGEIAELKIEDVFEAIKNNDNLIKMRTLKKKEYNSIRYVPITNNDLFSLKKFIKIDRAKIIKNTIGKEFDEGFVFVNEKTGKSIIPPTISNELTIIRNNTDIKEKVCAHMFRHRFITKLFVKLIKQYNYENPEKFRMALLDVNSLKQRIQQITGHTNLSSLDNYIDLAFQELTNFNEVTDKVAISNIYESYDRNLEILTNNLENGLITIKEFSKRQKELINLKNKDLKKHE